jgi:hypothetical protein
MTLTSARYRQAEIRLEPRTLTKLLILKLTQIPNETNTAILGKTPKPKMKVYLVCECVKSNALLTGKK